MVNFFEKKVIRTIIMVVMIMGFFSLCFVLAVREFSEREEQAGLEITRTESAETTCKIEQGLKNCVATIFPKMKNVQAKNGAWVDPSEVLNVHQESDDIIIEYSCLKGDYSISFEVGVVFNGKSYSIEEIKQSYPEVQLQAQTDKNPGFVKYAISISNLPNDVQNGLESVVLSYKNHTGFDVQQLESEQESLIVNDLFILSFEDLKNSGFTVNVDKAESKVYVGNLDNKILLNSLYLDPTVTLKVGNITEDGYIQEISGSKYRDSSGSYLYNGHTGGYYYRSYIEFNTTIIPDYAIVNYVNLSLQVQDAAGGNCDIYEIERKVGEQNDTELYNDIGNGTSYLYNNNFCTSFGWKTIQINTANSTLQNQLDEDWFAVGLKQNYYYDLGYFYSSEGGGSGYSPRLTVSYSLPKAMLQLWRNKLTKANVSWVDNQGNWYMAGNLNVSGNLYVGGCVKYNGGTLGTCV